MHIIMKEWFDLDSWAQIFNKNILSCTWWVLIGKASICHKFVLLTLSFKNILITVNGLLRVNYDIMKYANWDFNALNSQICRISALNKHQNRNISAFFCFNSQAQSKYGVINLIQTQHTLQTVLYSMY